MFTRIVAIVLFWLFAPLHTYACEEPPTGCVDLRPSPSEKPSWFDARRNEPAAAPHRSSDAEALFGFDAKPRPVQTLTVGPDGKIAATAGRE